MMKVFVKLLIISKEVEGDPKAERLLDIVQNGILSDAKQAKTVLQQQQHDYDYDKEEDDDDDNIAVSMSIQKQVTRFLQTKDKYTALTSMLMKSQAFYNTYNNNNNNYTTDTANTHQKQKQRRRRCVVELPRTKFKKPYIPAVVLVDSNKRNSIINKEEDIIYPISVSHQYPFVGLARLLIPLLNATTTMDHNHTTTTPNVANNSSNHHQLVIGMDIVAFDPPNPKLYSSVDEFINVFRSSSFTEWEWSLITDNHENNYYHHQLHEFYIRWSIKESYTKALGLGMGIDFTSFEMRLLLDDDVGDDGQSKSLWRRIQLATIQQSQKKDAVKGCYIPGSICHLESGKVEYWDFFFMPLFPHHDCQDIDSTVQNQNDHDADYDNNARGCMCICVGPYDTTQPSNSTTDHRFQVDIEWTNLQSLIDWHHP